MKSLKTCELCSDTCSDIPFLVCRHFICSACYVKMKAENKNCKCINCDTKLKRKI